MIMLFKEFLAVFQANDPLFVHHGWFPTGYQANRSWPIVS